MLPAWALIVLAGSVPVSAGKLQIHSSPPRARLRRHRSVPAVAPGPSRQPKPLSVSKTLWGSGYDAKKAGVATIHDGHQWLTWTPQAEDIFRQRWQELQFPVEGCYARSFRGYIGARTDMEWGVTSVIRDVQDQLLYSLFTGKFLVFTPYVVDVPAIQEAMQQYRSQCSGSGPWMENCYFQQLTGCTQDYLAGKLPNSPDFVLDRRTFQVTGDHGWFLSASQPLWDEMVHAGAISRGSGGAPPGKVSLLATGAGTSQAMRLEAAERLAVFRALLLRVAFKPNAALQRAIASVETRTGLVQAAAHGPVTVVHVRRTDKARDFAGTNETPEALAAFNASARGVSATLGTIAGTLLPWLEQQTAPATILFLMSDDWHTFEPEARAALTQHLRNSDVRVLFDKEGTKLEPRDEKTLQLGNEAWGNKAAVGMQVLAESFAAGKWAHHIVGCGSSGVTQLVAQLMGGRARVDPNALGLWEDDSVNVRAVRREAPARPAGASPMQLLGLE